MWERRHKLLLRSRTHLNIGVALAVITAAIFLTQIFTDGTIVEGFPVVLIALVSILNSYYAGRLRRRAYVIHP
jgi:hypothetical protein